MNSLAGRKKAEKKPELTEDEKFVLGLSNEVATFLTLHKAAYFGYAKNLEKLLDAKTTAPLMPVAMGAGAPAASAADAYDVESGNTALILACRNGHAKCVQLLLDKGKANVNLAGFAGLTALHHACLQDQEGALALLLERGHAHVNVEDDAGNTPVSLAARMGNLRCLELVAARGAHIDHPNKRGATPLMQACLHGRIAVVDALLRKKQVNLAHTDREGNSALHVAASCGYLRLVRQLLSAGADASITNHREEKAEDVAFNEPIRALLKTYGGGGANAAAAVAGGDAEAHESDEAEEAQ
jgi:ankyrin repeat protein